MIPPRLSFYMVSFLFDFPVRLVALNLYPELLQFVFKHSPLSGSGAFYIQRRKVLNIYFVSEMTLPQRYQQGLWKVQGKG